MRQHFLVPFIVVAGALMGSACATTTAARSPDHERMAREIAALREENARLAAVRSDEAPADAEVAADPGLVPPDFVPPGRPETSGPPQNWGWLHAPPYDCERGPYALRISNHTEHFLRIFLDGEEIMVRGSSGLLPHLPPGERLYVCLRETGTHAISGVAYSPRMGEMLEIEGREGRFTVSRTFRTPVSRAIPFHRYDITNAVMRVR